MWCIVNLPNGTQLAVKWDTKAIGQECLEKVCTFFIPAYIHTCIHKIHKYYAYSLCPFLPHKKKHRNVYTNSHRLSKTFLLYFIFHMHICTRMLAKFFAFSVISLVFRIMLHYCFIAPHTYRFSQ